MRSLPVPTQPRVEIFASCDEATESTSYTSSRPVPVAPLLPLSIAVYEPGARVVQMADSRESAGLRLAGIWAALTARAQLSLTVILVPVSVRKARTGSCNVPVSPKVGREGPSHRMRICLEPAPAIIKPAIN